jgi:signal transduction histidine kinase
VPVTSWRGLAADLAVASVATAIMILASLQSADQPSRPLEPVWALAAIGVVGAWTALARRYPRVALVGACATFYAALAAGVPAFSPALALGVPVLVAAWSGHLWWGVAVLGVIGLSSPYRLVGPGAEPAEKVALGTLFDVALVAVLLLLGETLRSRRVLREETSLRLQLAEQEHRRRLTEARLRAARDLHDVLAHTVAVVGIHASVAAETIDSRPGEAKQAMERVRSATREATADLRSTIAVLREDGIGPSRDPAPGVQHVRDLVAAVGQAGVEASLSILGETGALRPAVDITVYRIVQESLTNVLRHSDAGAVRIDIECTAEAVDVRIRDDGKGGSKLPRELLGGSGLQGMAERVSAIGGRLQHGYQHDGAPGYLVHARLPIGGSG